MSENRLKIGIFALIRVNFREKRTPTTNHSSSHKTSINDFMWYKNVSTSYCRFVTIHTFDRQTDRRTDSFLLARPRCMHRGKNYGSKIYVTWQAC